MGTESEVFLNKHAPSASLLFETEIVTFQSRLNDDVKEIVCSEFLWYGLISTYFVAFFQNSAKLYQDKSPGKRDFIIKNLIAP